MCVCVCVLASALPTYGMRPAQSVTSPPCSSARQARGEGQAAVLDFIVAVSSTTTTRAIEWKLPGRSAEQT